MFYAFILETIFSVQRFYSNCIDSNELYVCNKKMNMNYIFKNNQLEPIIWYNES